MVYLLDNIQIDLKECAILGLGFILGTFIFRYIKKPRASLYEDEPQAKNEQELYFHDEDLQEVRDELKSTLTCGIDSSVIRCPMISPYGFTTEREAIVMWLRQKSECPFTKQVLFGKELRFNKNVFDAIQFLVLKESFNKKHQDNKITYKEILD